MTIQYVLILFMKYKIKLKKQLKYSKFVSHLCEMFEVMRLKGRCFYMLLMFRKDPHSKKYKRLYNNVIIIIPISSSIHCSSVDYVGL